MADCPYLYDALDLSALAGPIATTANTSGGSALRSDPVDPAAGTAQEQWHPAVRSEPPYTFTTAATLDGVFARPAEGGDIIVPTLRLNVGGLPGTPAAAATYRVTLTDAYAIDGANLRATLAPGPALAIVVPAQ